MDASNSLMLIDSDVRRRAAVCHELASSGIHVEPFEDTFEIKRRWPRSGTILAEDADGNIPPGAEQRINDQMAELVGKFSSKLHGLATVDAFSGDAAARDQAVDGV